MQQQEQPQQPEVERSTKWLADPWASIVSLLDSGAPALTAGHSGRTGASPLLLIGKAVSEARRSGKPLNSSFDVVLSACMEVVAQRVGRVELLTSFSRMYEGTERECIRLVFDAGHEGARACQQLLEDRNLRVSVGGVNLVVPVTQHSRLVELYNVKVILDNLPGECARRGIGAKLLSCAGYNLNIISEHLPEVVGGVGRLRALPRCDKLVVFALAPPCDMMLRRLPATFTIQEHTVSIRVSGCDGQRSPMQVHHTPPATPAHPWNPGAPNAHTPPVPINPRMHAPVTPAASPIAGDVDMEEARRQWSARRAMEASDTAARDGTARVNAAQCPSQHAPQQPLQHVQHHQHPPPPGGMRPPTHGSHARAHLPRQRQQGHGQTAPLSSSGPAMSHQPARQSTPQPHGDSQHRPSSHAPTTPQPQPKPPPRRNTQRRTGQDQQGGACQHAQAQHGATPSKRVRPASAATSQAASRDGYSSDDTYGAAPSTSYGSESVRHGRSAFLVRLHDKGGQDWVCDAYMRTLPKPRLSAACLRNLLVHSTFPVSDALVSSLTDRLQEFDDLSVFRNDEERVQLFNWLYIDYRELWTANCRAATVSAVTGSLLQELRICAEAMQALFAKHADLVCPGTTSASPTALRRSTRVRASSVAAGAAP